MIIKPLENKLFLTLFPVFTAIHYTESISFQYNVGPDVRIGYSINILILSNMKSCFFYTTIVDCYVSVLTLESFLCVTQSHPYLVTFIMLLQLFIANVDQFCLTACLVANSNSSLVGYCLYRPGLMGPRARYNTDSFIQAIISS